MALQPHKVGSVNACSRAFGGGGRSVVAYVSEAPEHHNNHNPPFSARDNSITMNPILDAIAAIDSAEPREQLSYRAVGTKFNVNAKTLRRRHQGTQLDYAEAANNKQLLSPQQEIELVQYINELTEQGLPPTRTMIQNFGSAVAL